MIPGVLEIVSVGLLISACLAIFLDEAVYSVSALAATFFLTAFLYALADAPFVAIFQFAVGIGTIAVLFLSGEMLSERPETKTKSSTTLAVAGLGGVLSLPAIFFSISSPNEVVTDFSFGDALWNFSAVDVVLQGLVILTVALGITIVLHKRKRIKKRRGVQ
ncbi:MAG: NADH-quinone oxidoreductase subunit J [Candidatus Bathyarchaeota archaeon]|nr:NADH-quinone oxidoreductase subunit J [Candidatus Bathyarchaeota archaeon]